MQSQTMVPFPAPFPPPRELLCQATLLRRLPAELVLQISRYLDNVTLLRLSLAWRYFLDHFAVPFQPWHPLRQKLRQALERAGYFDGLPLLLRALFVSSEYGRSTKEEIFQHPAIASALVEFLELLRPSVTAVAHIVQPLRFGFREISNTLATGLVRLERQATSHTHSLIEMFTIVDRGERLTHVCALLSKTQWLETLRIAVPKRHEKAVAKCLSANQSLHNLSLHLVSLDTISASIRVHPNLRKLVVDPLDEGMDAGIVVEAPESLANLFSCATIKHMQLEKMWFLASVSDWSAVSLAIGANTMLAFLELDSCQFTAPSIDAMLRSLKHHPRLETLRIFRTNLGQDQDLGIDALTDLLKHNQRIHSVDLRYNNITHHGSIALGRMLRENTGLQLLDVSQNFQDPYLSMEMVQGFVRHPRLEKLFCELRQEPGDQCLATIRACAQEFGFKLKRDVTLGDRPTSLLEMTKRMDDGKTTKRFTTFLYWDVLSEEEKQWLRTSVPLRKS